MVPVSNKSELSSRFVPACLGVQSVKLELRNIEGKNAWNTNKLFEDGRPVLWAPAKVWEALRVQDLLIPGTGTEQSVKVSERQGASSSISWVFVPSFNRYHAKPDKQMLLDWADAMPEDHPYIRFIVIKPLPAEEQVAEPSPCGYLPDCAGSYQL